MEIKTRFKPKDKAYTIIDCKVVPFVINSVSSWTYEDKETRITYCSHDLDTTIDERLCFASVEEIINNLTEKEEEENGAA